MAIVTQETVNRAISRLQTKIEPLTDLFLEADPLFFQKVTIVVLLFALLIYVLKKSKQKKQRECEPVNQNQPEEPGGFKNYKGDTWYPDGRVWHKDKKSWEKPDYEKRN